MVSSILVPLITHNSALNNPGTDTNTTTVVQTLINRLFAIEQRLLNDLFIRPADSNIIISTTSLLLQLLLIVNSHSRYVVGLHQQVNNNMVLQVPIEYEQMLVSCLTTMGSSLTTDVYCLLMCILYQLTPEKCVELFLSQCHQSLNTITNTTSNTSISTYSSFTRNMNSIEALLALLQYTSGLGNNSSTFMKRKTVLNAMFQQVPAMLQSVINHSLQTVGNQCLLSSNSATTCSDILLASLSVIKSTVSLVRQLVTTCGKSYISILCYIYDSVVELLLTEVDLCDRTTTTTTTSTTGIKSSIGCVLLSSNNYMKTLSVFKEVLSATEDIGKLAIGGSGNTLTTTNLNLTYKLLVQLAQKLQHDGVRSELLSNVLQCGWNVVKDFWSVSSVSTSNGINQGATLAAQLQDTNSGTVSDNSGISVKPVVELLVQLYAGCLSGSTIPPGDVYICTSNMSQMGSDGRAMFAQAWFIGECRQTVIMSSLRALLLDLHASQHESIIYLLQVIINQSAEDWNEYTQYYNSIVVGISIEKSCQSDAELLMNAYMATHSGDTTNINRKLDVLDYTQHVIYTISQVIIQSENCLSK